MYEFLKWTAWEMERPTSYGLFHILATIILLAITILGVYLLRKTNDKQNKIVLGVTGGVLLLFEVYKILFHVYLDPYGWGGFWGVFPFQLCSLPMYLCIVCALIRSDKVNSWLYECMFAINIVGGIMGFIEPSGINHDYWTLTLHAYIWHMSLVFIALYLYKTKRACMNAKNYYKAVAVYLSSCAVAQMFNIIFKSKGINCYYISPYVQSPLAVFKDIWANFGWFANMLLLPIAILLASALIYYLGYYLRKINSKKQIENKD